jgi:broad specificity phosphatase PhoE
MRARLLLCALLLLCPAVVAAQTTTVIVVRHAEKQDTTRLSPLNEAGRARAEALAAALADAHIDAIYATQYPRSLLTAEPLAQRLKLTPVVINAGGDVNVHAQTIAQRIRADHAGRTVLVVGHSNTVPLIVKALSGVDVGKLADGDYDDMFIVQLDSTGARLLRAGYPPRAPR